MPSVPEDELPESVHDEHSPRSTLPLPCDATAKQPLPPLPLPPSLQHLRRLASWPSLLSPFTPQGAAAYARSSSGLSCKSAPPELDAEEPTNAAAIATTASTATAPVPPSSPVSPPAQLIDCTSCQIRTRCVRASYADAPNAQFRPTMEDAVTLTTLSCGGSYLGVYDGHGGAWVAHYVAETLHQHFDAIMNEQCEDAADAFVASYALVDSELRSQRAFTCGATSVTAYICARGRTLTIANAGDSRAVLGDAHGNAARLTEDHRPQHPGERRRLRDAGAFVCGGRVNGTLAISRSFGDHAMKSAVVSVPDVHTLPLTPEHRFLILACDGLWDVVEDDEATRLVAAMLADRTAGVAATPASLSRALVQRALDKGSTDNVSVAVALLAHPDRA